VAGAQRTLAEDALPDVAALLAEGAARDKPELRVAMTVGALEAAVRQLVSASPDAESYVPRLRAARDDIVDLALVILRP